MSSKARGNVGSFDFNSYNPAALIRMLKSGEVTEKDLRREYTMFRDIAQKRLKRLAESEYTSSETFQAHREGFGKTKDITSVTDLVHQLTEVQRFVNSRASSVSGQRAIREMTIRQLKKHFDVQSLTNKNINQFFRFMNKARAAMKGRQYGSERLLELWDQLKEHKINPDRIWRDFDFWLNNVEALADAPVPESATTSTQMRNLVESYGDYDLY